MSAIILQNPRSPVSFDGPTAASIVAAKAAQQAERAQIEADQGVQIDEDGTFHLPAPMVTDPLTIGPDMDLPTGDVCVACQEKVELHWDSSGCLWIGCLGALNRRNGHQDGG